VVVVDPVVVVPLYWPTVKVMLVPWGSGVFAAGLMAST
jgi:hypothetical protein